MRVCTCTFLSDAISGSPAHSGSKDAVLFNLFLLPVPGELLRGDLAANEILLNEEQSLDGEKYGDVVSPDALSGLDEAAAARVTTAFATLDFPVVRFFFTVTSLHLAGRDTVATNRCDLLKVMVLVLHEACLGSAGPKRQERQQESSSAYARWLTDSHLEALLEVQVGSG